MARCPAPHQPAPPAGSRAVQRRWSHPLFRYFDSFGGLEKFGRRRRCGSCRSARRGRLCSDRRCLVFVHEQMRVGNFLRPKFGARDHHAGAKLGQRPQVYCELMRHANTAVRSRMAQIKAFMKSHTRPGEALHERHRCIAIDVGAMLALFLDDIENAERRRMLRYSGCNRRIGYVRAVAVEMQLLLVDGNDDLQRALWNSFGRVPDDAVPAQSWSSQSWC